MKDVWYNKGITLRDLGLDDEAKECFARKMK